MSETRIYIAGPMTGIKWFNFPAFDAARDKWQATGAIVISPADLARSVGLDGTLLPENTDWSGQQSLGFKLDDTIRRDFEALMTCDSIYMLDGWRNSRGAQAEHALAQWRRMQTFYAPDDTLDRIFNAIPKPTPYAV